MMKGLLSSARRKVFAIVVGAFVAAVVVYEVVGLVLFAIGVQVDYIKDKHRPDSGYVQVVDGQAVFVIDSKELGHTP